MNFEDEMSRFEAEINRTTAVAAAAMMGGGRPRMMDPAFIPHQINAWAGLPPPPLGAMGSMQFRPPQLGRMVRAPPTATTISAAPRTDDGAVAANKEVAKQKEEEEEDIFSKLSQYEQQHKKERKELKKAKKAAKAKTGMTPSAVVTKSAAPVAAAPPPPPPALNTSVPPPGLRPFATAPSASSSTPVSATISDETFKKAKKQKRIIRTGGGQVWEDASFKEWDTNDFR